MNGTPNLRVERRAFARIKINISKDKILFFNLHNAKDIKNKNNIWAELETNMLINTNHNGIFSDVPFNQNNILETAKYLIKQLILNDLLSNIDIANLVDIVLQEKDICYIINEVN